MPATIPSAWRTQAQKIHGTQPWVWLWQIQADATSVARTVFRICSYPAQVSYSGMAFYPMSMTQSAIVVSGGGDLPQMDLTIDNTTRSMLYYFETGNGFMGQPATGYLVNLADLASAAQYDFVVRGAQVTNEAVTLHLEMPNFFSKLVPANRYNPHRCRHIYGSSICGYVLNDLALYQTCPRTVTACIARGVDMVNRNLPAVVPMRFGAFLGIMKQ